MSTRYFKALQAVLESGIFFRAASDLNITQSAVSQRTRFMGGAVRDAVDRSLPCRLMQFPCSSVLRLLPHHLLRDGKK